MENRVEKGIGILDSGVGGLTVAKEVMRQLPRESIYYFGDNLRCPYGSRTEEEVKKFTMQIVRFLIRFPIKAILIACNTATAVALEDIKRELDIPVLGVIKPGARAAIKATRNNQVGVIGTEVTVHSQAYEKALKQLHPALSIHSLACPSFVPLVEQGYFNSWRTNQKVRDELSPFHQVGLDTLILGCTHYPLLMPAIKEAMGPRIRLISSAQETASELSTILQHQDLLSHSVETKHHFYTSGQSDQFKKIADQWLGKDVIVKKVELSESGYILV